VVDVLNLSERLSPTIMFCTHIKQVNALRKAYSDLARALEPKFKEKGELADNEAEMLEIVKEVGPLMHFP
jgi:hypothetical protein